MAVRYLVRKAALGVAYRILAGLELGTGLAAVVSEGHNAALLLPVTLGLAALLWSLGTLAFQDRDRSLGEMQEAFRRAKRRRERRTTRVPR